MSSTMFWVWFWHIVGLICILIICAPSAILRRYGEAFSLHPRLQVKQVADAHVSGGALPAEEWAGLVQAFNDSNFLYSKYFPPASSGDIELVTRSGTHFVIQLFEGRARVTKRRRRHAKTYYLAADVLTAWSVNLLERRQD